ncbi:MAG: hypothetical protein ACTSX6_04630 [Candidatus Heimdallarchaeaceae archaeon]
MKIKLFFKRILGIDDLCSSQEQFLKEMQRIEQNIKFQVIDLVNLRDYIISIDKNVTEILDILKEMKEK